MAISLQKLNKSFGNTVVLKDLSFTAEEGEIVCLMGPSGVGKTTLLMLLAGLYKADSGEFVGLKGKQISMVFQENRLLPDEDAVTNVRAVLEKNSACDIAAEFAAVGLSDYEGKPVGTLSGGMQRRVALVRAVCAKSDLLLLDEPFTGLDDETKILAMDYLLSRRGERTTVLSTHDAKVAKRLNARVVYLENKID